MEQQNSNNNLPALHDRLLTQLHSLQYCESTLAIYRCVLTKVRNYMNKHDENSYSEEIGERFYQEWQHQDKPSLRWKHYVRSVINRLNDVLNECHFIFQHSLRESVYPTAFHQQLDNYVAFLKKSGNKPSTINVRRIYCAQFLCFLETRGLTSLTELQPLHIYEAFAAINSKEGFSEKIPVFLKYLYNQKILYADYSAIVPKYRPPQIVPTVYSNEEVECLLNTVEQSTTIGKRDYTILLISSRLGMRASDICNLTFENLHCETETIEIIQQKTGTPLILPLLPEIKDALDKYSQAGRPSSDTHNIFLRNSAPFLPLSRKTVWDITTKYFNKSKINMSGKKHGPHALRTSLASSLIAENVPYRIVQEILGHEDPNSTKHYAKIDICQLRRYALEVTPPSGLFAQCLNEKGGKS